MPLFQLACWGWFVVCAIVIRTYWRTPRLDAYAPEQPRWPSVSIVVPARNEAHTLGRAVETLLGLDYPELELVLINDRSTDGTGDLLEALALRHPRLQVVHIDALPVGWLGKTHALHHGSARATGEILLFTDADVHFAPASLKRAVAALQQTGSDHLACVPEIVCESFWEKIFIPFFVLAFGLRYRPDLGSSPNPDYFIGVGAFNMIRAEVYRAIGGHSLLRMLVVDDLELGHLVKLRGYRQLVLRAFGDIRVRWTVGLRGIVTGLEKNIYAGFDYRLGQVLFSTLVLSVASIAPVVITCAGPTWLGLMAWTVLIALCGSLGTGAGGARWSGVFFPLAGLLMAFTVLRSVALAESRRGIWWRDNFYALDELRQHHLV
jgi:hypothetical protein